ncbi:cytosine permease [Streptomyces sp. NPDC002785]|uniref:cytosine permease n=1 Tax=Streptomyces sp. NPDC002785 TaxID=3154543 RepID=UPI003324FE89
METHDLEPVPDSERTGRVRNLFPTWACANPTAPPLTMGAGLTIFNGPNFWQAPAALVAAPHRWHRRPP